MVYGIISDIHSNLEATIAVLDELEQKGVNKIICLGDIVGYGANPNECVELIRKKSECVVIGNHDAGAIGLTKLSNFNRFAFRACVWTSKVLTNENKEWLKNLPLMVSNERKIIVHSTPSNPSAWDYIITLEDAAIEFENVDFELCFVGHSHCPAIFMLPATSGAPVIIQDSTITLSSGARYIINPGSVGQPRNGDPRASYAIYDTGKKVIEILRVPYDIMRAQEKILDVGLPTSLAYRLGVGR